jgi:hypothetical protein
MPQGDTWFDFGQHPCVEQLIKISGKYFDVSAAIGYEMHKNVIGPKYHYDKDEMLFETTGVLSLPLCSIVYYPKVENMQGGDLVFNDLILLPIPNRLVIFSPDRMHGVNDHTGTRISVGINPWAEKPLAYR